ncbi:hypothetical protein HPB48_027027 [Haemaphysalis longicornis]|uniref:Uncharacterized protein n=1 Tax=Haemaphysalis longicornis TaxID=44386 RepID=A0A9J6H2S2_HAELO|nr:hypothetical protein HPB48_027027 [Haemaphysalis longicornis]
MAALRLVSELHGGCRSIPNRCGLLRASDVLRIGGSSTAACNNDYSRRLKSSASPAALDRTTESAACPTQRDPLDLSFNDARAAYKSKTTGELLRGYVVLKLSSSNWIVNNHQEVSSSGVLTAACHSFIPRGIAWLLRPFSLRPGFGARWIVTAAAPTVGEDGTQTRVSEGNRAASTIAYRCAGSLAAGKYLSIATRFDYCAHIPTRDGMLCWNAPRCVCREGRMPAVPMIWRRTGCNASLLALRLSALNYRFR